MLANMGSGSGARHLWRQAPVAAGADASKLGYRLVPGNCCGRMDASKHGVWIGAKHPLRGGWMLANRGLDLVPGTCCGAAGC